MTRKTIFKIKDSVDLFLSNGKYLMVYYMNTRQRKCFRVNDEMIHLLENIDAQNDYDDLISIMQKRWEVSPSNTDQALSVLHQNRIITEVVEDQSILSEELVDRYSRQINYFSEFLDSELDGIVAQRKLINSHVVIFGCGAIGGDIAIQLAMAGIGHITLYDHDLTEASDISRHMYFREEYLGLDKVESLKRELCLINPEIIISTVKDSMQPESDIASLIINADFIVNTLDEPYIGYTASKISRICMKYNKPHYIAGGFDAHLGSTGEIIIPYVTPCVECYTSHFKTVLKDWKPEKHPVTKRYNEIGGLPSLSLFSSSYACIEIIKYLAGLVPMVSSYKVRGEFLFHDMSLSYLNVLKNPKCPVCGGQNINEP